jgi:hypothetical protein
MGAPTSAVVVASLTTPPSPRAGGSSDVLEWLVDEQDTTLTVAEIAARMPRIQDHGFIVDACLSNVRAGSGRPKSSKKSVLSPARA